MPNEKGMSDDKKAKLEAIRAANAAKKAAEGGVPEAPTAAIATQPADTTTSVATASAPAGGANMSDEKKAKLEAIRAANAAKKGEAPAVAPAPAAAATATPAAAATAAPAPAAKPAPARVPVVQTPKVIQDDSIPLRVYAIRALIGAVLGVILFVMLATLTEKYAVGAAWGAFIGAAIGLLVFNWPPVRTTGE